MRETSAVWYFHSNTQHLIKSQFWIICDLLWNEQWEEYYYSSRSNVTRFTAVKYDITQLLSLSFFFFLFFCSHHVFWNYCCSIASPRVWPPLIDVWSYRPAFSPRGGGDIILGVAWPILLPIWLPLPASWLSRGPGLYAAGVCPITHWAAGTVLLWWLWLVFCVPR